MADQLQLRGGTTAEHSTFTGALREVTVDTDKDVLVVHDNATAGGHPLMAEDGSNSALALGTVGTPSLKFTGDTNTGVFSPGADQLAVSTAGVERVEFGASEVVFNDGGADYNFRVEGDTDANLVVVDASADSIGIGTDTPGTLIEIDNAAPYVTLKNNTHEDTDGGRESRLIFEGEQTGGEISTLAQIEVSHDGTGDDQQGKLVISTNDGADGATPTAAVTIDSSQRVGIGSSSPSDTLDIGTGGIFFSNQSSGSPYPEQKLKWSNDSTTANGFYISQGTDRNGKIWHEQGLDIQFGTSNQQRMVLDSSGRLGIGTASPSSNIGSSPVLDISGSFGGLALTSTTGTESKVEISNFGSNTMVFATNSAERARIDSSGRLGVGTSSPTEKLHVDGNAKATRFAAGSGGATAPDFTFSADATMGMFRVPGSLCFATGSTERMRLDANGNMSFQNAADINWLNAAGTSYSTGIEGSSDVMTFYTSDITRLQINSNGQLYSIPTYNNSSAISANVFVTSSGNFGRSTSSAKYKTDIETIEDSYSDALLKCRPVWYRSTSKLDNPDYGWWGFIAEEVAEIDPRLVFWKTVDITYDEKGSVVETPCDPEPEGVAYDRFVPHLLNLIKRQQQAIETLEAKVAALEAN